MLPARRTPLLTSPSACGTLSQMVRTQFFTLTWRMRRPIRNMLNWHQFLRAPPTVPLALAKWRHWKPGKVQDDTPVTQRQLETELRRRWAERLISHLAPYADQIPYMQTIEEDNVMESTLTFWVTQDSRLSGSDASPWRAFRKRGSHQSHGLNRMCGTFSTTSAHRRSPHTSCRGSGILCDGSHQHLDCWS